MEFSILNHSDVKSENKTFRIDAEFFKREFLDAINIIENCNYSYVDDVTSWVTQGPNPSFSESGIPCLTGRNINKGRISYVNPDYVDEDEYLTLSAYQLNIGDTLITLKGKGSIGKVGYVLGKKQSIFSRDIGVIRPYKIEPGYLNIFIQCKYGQLLVNRGETGGTGQSTLTTSYLKSIPVPRFKIEKEISNALLKVEEFLQQSENHYLAAEKLIIKALNLETWEPNNKLAYVKKFSETRSSKRLDAEYYQPKYDEILKAILTHSSGFNKLEMYIDECSTGYPFKSETYTENGTFLIRINNIVNGQLDLSNCVKIPNEDRKLSLKDIAKEDEILISMSGSIGNACKIPKGVDAVINQRIFKFKPKNYNIDILTLIINSVIGKQQLIRIGTGGVQTNISSNDIKKILIPILSQKLQSQIQDKINKSLTFLIKSKNLLECAKRAVEIAIEQDEETAIKWYEENGETGS